MRDAATVVRRYGVPCVPPPWARGGHAQTLLAHLLPSPGRRLDGEREVLVDLGDGDRLQVFARRGTSGVRVHLFHGLAGDVSADYMRRTADVMSALGHEVWAVNHRGCDDRDLAVQPYHSGRSEDMQAVLRESRRLGGAAVDLVVGFSLSANMALVHAAQNWPEQPHGIVAVNPPADLHRASIDIGLGLNRLYQARFMWRLKRAVRERERRGQALRKYDIALGLSLLEFDDLFTAPECGFEDGLDYYRRCSSAPRLGEVGVPSVILTAADDPFVAPETFEQASRSEAVFLHIEPVGGHVGYLARRGAGWTRWLDGALTHYVNELAPGPARPPA